MRTSPPRSPSPAAFCSSAFAAASKCDYLHFPLQVLARSPHWPLLFVRLRQACSSSLHFCRHVAWAANVRTQHDVQVPVEIEITDVHR